MPPKHSCSRARRRRGGLLGFSLLELMIAVAIVGILAMIALPAYQEYIRRSNRAAAKTVLAEFIARQEAWRADRKSFATLISDLGYEVSGAVTYILRDASTSTSATGASYRMEVTNSGGAFVSVQAVPLGSQATDKCGTLVVAATGAKSVTGAASGWTSDKCWKG